MQSWRASLDGARTRLRGRNDAVNLAQFDFPVLVAVVFLFSSAGLMALSMCVPRYLRDSWLPIYFAVAVLTFLGGVLTARIGRVSGPGAAFLMFYSDVAIVIAAFSQENRSSGRLDAALLILPTLFIAVFLSWTWTLAQAVAAGGCGWLILYISGDRASVIAIQALIIMSSASCPALIVLILRSQLSAALGQAQAMATTDPLTGLLNRRGLDARSADLVARAGRAGLPIGVLVADIDHFKKVNDKYGHTTRDQVLRQVSAATRGCVRAEDLAVRLGGEEIAVIGIIAPDQLELLAERLRLAVQTAGRTWAVTVSIGMAYGGPGPVGTATELLWSLIDSADDRMYEAKQGGRNQVRGQREAGRRSG